MLFADIVGSSQIAEDVVPHFVGSVLGPLAETARQTPVDYIDSWGDGMFLAYSSQGGSGGGIAADAAVQGH